MLFSTKQFLSRAEDRRILFLHGGRDERIPRDIVEGDRRHSETADAATFG